MLKYLLLFLSLASFIPNGSYLLQAWKSSPLETLNWLFFLLAVPAAFRGLKNNPPGRWDLRGAVPLLFSLVLLAAKNHHQINALCVVSSSVFVWSMAFLTGGWGFAGKLLPFLFLMLLGTPGSTYYLAKFLMLSTPVAWGVKFLAAAGAFGWLEAAKRFNWQPKVGSLLFSGTAFFSALFLFHAEELYFTGRRFTPAFPLRAGDFYGRKISPDANTQRFFATSSVAQYRYLHRGEEISVLAVRCGKNVHEIHPASHCLRTSRWTVTSEKLFFLREDFAVTEISAVKNRQQTLIWVWYSSDEFSTPGFTGFRRRFKPNGKYHTYQFAVPINKNITVSRKILKDFLTALKEETPL